MNYCSIPTLLQTIFLIALVINGRNMMLGENGDGSKYCILRLKLINEKN